MCVYVYVGDGERWRMWIHNDNLYEMSLALMPHNCQRLSFKLTFFQLGIETFHKKESKQKMSKKSKQTTIILLNMWQATEWTFPETHSSIFWLPEKLKLKYASHSLSGQKLLENDNHDTSNKCVKFASY